MEADATEDAMATFEDVTAHGLLEIETAPPAIKQTSLPALMDSNAVEAEAAKKAADAKKKEEQEAAKKLAETAIKNLRSCHGDWDRKRNDLNGVIERRKLNENTSGCKIERDLVTIVETCDEIDNRMLKVNTAYIATQQLGKEDIEELKRDAEELVRTAKTGSQKASALKQCFNI